MTGKELIEEIKVLGRRTQLKYPFEPQAIYTAINRAIDEVNRLYANCGVDLRMEFVMATHDPEGNLLAEPGVDRQKINVGAINSSTFIS